MTSIAPLERLIQALMQLPNVGEKTATRLALFLLRDTQGVAEEMIRSLTTVREKVRFCQICQNITEEEVCSICRDPARNHQTVCVIQEPVDLLLFEKMGDYNGVYHVLHGALSPLDGIGPEDIRLQSLIDRARNGLQEIILATNPNAEGETTALYLKKLLAPAGLKITRIASGVPVGGVLEYTDVKTLARALGNRREF